MPVFSKKEIETLARQHFGLVAEASALPGEIDFNFLLETPSGQRFTLKIAHAAERRECLDCQNEMLRHLEAREPSLPLPRVVPNVAGEFVTIINKGVEGGERFMRLLTWSPGRLLAQVNPHSPELLESLGKVIGQLCRGLQGFAHPAARRFIKWDVSQGIWAKEKLHLLEDPDKRSLAEHFFQRFENEALPRLASLRRSVIYNDANDWNILVSEDLENSEVTGVIDFGDFVFSNTVNDLAIAVAYAAMDKPDPLAAAAAVVRGMHPVFPLEEAELEILYHLVAARLLISVVCSAENLLQHPENQYLLISERPAWDLLRKWRDVPPALAHFTFRQACGMEPCPAAAAFYGWAFSKKTPCQPPVPNLGGAALLDLSVGSLDLGGNDNFDTLPRFDKTIRRLLDEAGAETGVGGYGEVRPFYSTDAYRVMGNEGAAWRTVHLGLDIWSEAGTPVLAPLDGKVHSFQNNAADRDYGATIILEHEVFFESKKLVFNTLYGHLSLASLEGLAVGQVIRQGEKFAETGAPLENGNWPPHLHFQVILDMLDKRGDFPGVAFPDQREVWTSICPDPALLFETYAGTPIPVAHSADGTGVPAHILRQRFLPKNLSLSYRQPLHVVRGWRQHLYAADGRRYLDTVNNVAHVGHEHPAVVRAAARQSAVLNTNSRYLHANLPRFAEALLATLPAPLEIVFVVNSGSEANELALRLARNFTGRRDVVAVEAGYHGNTGACVEISSYKFDGPGGKGAPPFVQVLPMPDVFRGLRGRQVPENQVGKMFASYAEAAVRQAGKGIAAFICESILSCGGQVVLPENYLAEVYRTIRSAGGACIADEVQTGCGRVGSHFWAFEMQGVVPDIVTIGKPIGNGHPLAAVATTRAIADAFANGMEYFNTFGGNPVSCAVGLEVLKIIREEGLQARALETGGYLFARLRELERRFPLIGDVRGQGLFLGFELVKNPDTLDPAATETAYLANRLRTLGILASTDGPLHNVLKIKPPMVFDKSDADFFADMAEQVLREDFMKI